MNCNEAIPLLSPFHDGELAPEEHQEVADHVASCAACTQKLESIRRLSDLVESNPVAGAPATLLPRIERSLAERAPFWTGFQLGGPRKAVAALVAVAAAVIIGVTIWKSTAVPPHSHAGMVRAFGEFLDLYEHGNAAALDVLARKYQGVPVSEAAATTALKRATVAKPTILSNLEAAQRYVLKMPCCDCVQTIYTRDGQPSLVLFEHDKEQTEWFERRPVIRAECRGKACCLVQLKEGLAATWPVDGGFVTVVGVRDIVELGNLVVDLQTL